MATGMLGGELRYFLLDSQGQDVVGGHLRLRPFPDDQVGGAVRPPGGFGRGLGRRLRVQQGAGDAGDDHHVVLPVGGDGGVDRRVFEVAAQGFQRDYEQGRVETHHHAGDGLPLQAAVEGADQQIPVQGDAPGRLLRIRRLPGVGVGGVHPAQVEGHRSRQQRLGLVQRPGNGRYGEQRHPVHHLQVHRPASGIGEQGPGDGLYGGGAVDLPSRPGIVRHRGVPPQPDGTFERNVQNLVFIVGQQTVHRPFAHRADKFQALREGRPPLRQRLDSPPQPRRVGTLQHLLRKGFFVQVEADFGGVQGELGFAHPHRERRGGHGVLQGQGRSADLLPVGVPGGRGGDGGGARYGGGAGAQVVGDPVGRARDQAHPDQRRGAVQDVARCFGFTSVFGHFA